MSKFVIVADHIDGYNELLKTLDNEIDERSKRHEPGVRMLQNIRKQVKTLKKQVPKLKRVIPSNKNRVSGFGLPCVINEELRKFLKMDEGVTPTRNEIRNAINVYIHFDPDDERPQIQKWSYLNVNGARNLQNPANKSIIFPDTALAKLLDYAVYVDNVKKGNVKSKKKNKETGSMEEYTVIDTALTYCIIQKLYQKHIIKTVS